MDESEAAGEPFFGVVHVRTLHPPYQTDPAGPPPGLEFDQHVPSQRYEASLRYFDRMFGAFFEALQQKPYGKRTIVLFGPDHGEAFGQHGISSHCGKYYTEESHIPGFVFAPTAAWSDPVLAPKLAELRANSREFVSNVDLYPTLLDLAGLDARPLGAQLDGHALTQPLPPDRRYLFSNCAEFRRCPIRSFGFYQDGVKYIFHADQRRWEAFDEAADPRELHDVAASHPREIEANLPSLGRNQVLATLLGTGSP
jgi:arylsulfatase A-like enzyme